MFQRAIVRVRGIRVWRRAQSKDLLAIRAGAGAQFLADGAEHDCEQLRLRCDVK